VRITSFDIEQGWFEARNGEGIHRFFMKDYGITPVMREPTWKPEDTGITE